MKRSSVLYKVILMFVLVGMLSSLFAACNGNKGEEIKEDTSSKDTSSNETSVAEGKSYDEHIVFTIPAIDPESAGKDNDGNPDPTFEWLKEKFNFEFEWIPVTWDNYYQEKPSLWMAAGEQPDLIMLDCAPTRYNLFLNWVENGQLKPYPEFGDKYPNLQEKWDAAVNGKKFAIDGVVYAWPSFLDSAKYNFRAGKKWSYREDWAEAVDLRNENDEYTWDEWVALTKAVIEQDPGGNGEGKTIGWMMDSWMFPRCIDAVRAVSPFLISYAKVDGEWYWGPQLPESLEAVKLTKQLYDEGLVWKDQPIVKDQDDMKNYWNSGRLFATAANNTAIGDMPNDKIDFESANPGINYNDAVAWAIVKAPDGYVYCEETSDHWTETAMAPDLSQEKVDRWMDILDYLVSDEGYRLRNFGIPGVDWEIDDDGEMILNYPQNEDGTYDMPSGLAWGHVWQWAYRAGCSDNAQLINPGIPKWMREEGIRVMERMQEDDVKVIPFNVELNYFDGEKYNEVGVMEADIYNKIAALMVLDASEIEDEWNSWLASMESKVQPVLDELNAANVPFEDVK